MTDSLVTLTTTQALELLGSTVYFVPSVVYPSVPSTIPPDIAAVAVEFDGIVGLNVNNHDLKSIKDWIADKCWCIPAAKEFWDELPAYERFNSPKMISWWRREILNHVYYQIQEVLQVAGKAKNEQAGDEQQKWEFVPCELSEAEIADALGQFSDGGVLWDLAVSTMQEGYKLSITYEEKSDSFCASLTGKNCPKPNQGKTLTGWYDDPSSALAVVLYKANVKLGGVWVNPDQGKKRRG